MRGPIRIITVAAVAVCSFALMAASAFADADDQLFDTSAVGGVVLRDVTHAVPTNQPDALEFVNNGEVKLVTAAGTIVCTEIEFGTTVKNNALGAIVLALPFGVAEGDNCKVGALNVPTYFDTLASGAVGNAANGNVATVAVADTGVGTPIVAEVRDLKFSQNIPGIGFCTGDVNGKTGIVTNVVAGFVEESTPNLNVQFTKTVIPVAGTGCPPNGELTANFFLETPSTGTDTAFFKS